MLQYFLKLSKTKDEIFDEYHKEYGTDFKKMVLEQAAKNPYPFKSWFNSDGRAWIEFEPEAAQIYGNDLYLFKFLSSHCDNLNQNDYLSGICTYQGRQQRIVKALRKIFKDLAAKESEYFSDDLQERLQDLDERLKKYISWYEQSDQKALTGKYYILFSQRPEDVALMSSGKRWKSCMELGRGDKHKELFCEVASGGFVALLVSEKDMFGENPISRVHVRRIIAQNKKSYAIPEQIVYGKQVANFLQEVTKWIDEKQGEIPRNNNYELGGGKYTDSYIINEDNFIEGIYRQAALYLELNNVNVATS